MSKGKGRSRRETGFCRSAVRWRERRGGTDLCIVHFTAGTRAAAAVAAPGEASRERGGSRSHAYRYLGTLSVVPRRPDRPTVAPSPRRPEPAPPPRRPAPAPPGGRSSRRRRRGLRRGQHGLLENNTSGLAPPLQALHYTVELPVPIYPPLPGVLHRPAAAAAGPPWEEPLPRACLRRCLGGKGKPT